MQLDKEQLEKLAPQLLAHGFDPDDLPAPGTDAWRTMIRELSLRDPVLGQQAAGLVYDPAELSAGSLVDAQVQRARSRGGLGKVLGPLMKTKTANGDEVPNTSLARNFLIGGGALAALLLYFGLQNPTPPGVTRAKVVTPSSAARRGTAPSARGGASTTVPGPPSTQTGPVTATDNNPSPATGTSSDPTGFGTAGTVDTQSAPQLTSPELSPSRPSVDPTGFTASPSGSVASVPTAWAAPVVRPPRVVSAAPAPIRLTSAAPGLPAAPRLRLVTQGPGGSGSAEVNRVPARHLSASGGGASSAGAPTGQRGLVSTASGRATPSGASGRPGASGLSAVAAPVSTERVFALKTAVPAAAPESARLIKLPSASSATSRSAGMPLVGSDGAAAGSAQGNASDTPASRDSAGAYGLYQSAAAPDSVATPATPGRASSAPRMGLLSQGPASSTSGPAPGAAGGSEAFGLKSQAPTKTALNITPGAAAAVTPSLTTPSGAVPDARMPGSPAPVSAPVYPVGEPLAATLVLSAVVVDGAASTVPVFARTQDGATWRGSAQIDGRKRLQVQFTAVLRGGVEQAITADAYGSDGEPGLNASVRITTPTLAADLLSGVFGGVKAFADATANQRSVTVQAGTGTGGNVVSNTAANTPNFWLVTAGSALGQFQLPQNKATIVTVAQVRAGAALSIVVRGGGR